MAAIATASVEQTTRQTHTGDTAWTDISGAAIAAGSFVANATYIVWAKAQFGGSDENVLFGLRLVHGTTPTVFNGSTDEKEPTSQTDGEFHTYFFQVKFTRPGTAEAIKFQFRTLNGAKTVRADSLVILAIRLDADLVDGTDYKYGEDDETGATTAIEEASYTGFASITFTPGTASEDWLVVGCLNYLIDAGTFFSVLWRINRDSAADTAPFAQEEGENASDSRVNAMLRAYTLTAASHTFTVEAQDELDNADQNDHQFSSIFALRLDVFEDHTFDWTETEFSPSTTGVYEEMTGVASYTPQTAGDNVILATAVSDSGGNNRTAGIRVQVDATTAPVGHDGHDDGGSWDPTDENPMAVLAKVNMAASARDIDLSRIHRTRDPIRLPGHANRCPSEAGMMVCEQPIDPEQGAPVRCDHRTASTGLKRPSTTTAWWPTRGCCCRPRSPSISVCSSSSTPTSTSGLPRVGRTSGTSC